MVCGGMIDVLAGEKKFAPVWVRKITLEWLFSGLVQPQRMRRWLLWMPRFFWLVVKGCFCK